MLIEVYIALIFVTFVFLVLSFIPIGQKIKKKKQGQEGVLEAETQMYIPWFAWITMGLLVSLSIASMDIEIVSCATVTQAVNSSVANYDVITSAWSCNTTQYIGTPLAYLFGGLGILMFVYALYITIASLTGSLVDTIGGIK